MNSLPAGLAAAVDGIRSGGVVDFNSPGDFFSIHTASLKRGWHRELGYEVLLRIIKTCNIRCAYCFVSPQALGLSPGLIDTFIRSLPADKLSLILFVLSGGEPTLHKDFFKIITALQDKGFPRIIIQTNAIRFADAGFYNALPAKGCIEFFISLPSAEKAVYNQLTHSNGYDQAMAGISRITAHYPARLNFVINRQNYDSLLSTQAYVKKNFSRHNARLLISNLGCLESFPGGELLVSYRELLPVLKAALHSTPSPAFTLSGGCSFPLCVYRLLGKRINRRMLYLAGEQAIAYNSLQRQFYKNGQCRQCRETRYCYGFSSQYVKRFGDGEIKAL